MTGRSRGTKRSTRCSPAPSTTAAYWCTATCAGWAPSGCSMKRDGTPTRAVSHRDRGGRPVPVRTQGVRPRRRTVRAVRQEARHHAHDRLAGHDVLPELPALAAPHCTTRTGVRLVTVVPLPSWPNRLSPQQYTPPLGVAPHVWSPPAETTANVRPPATGTGLTRPPVVPSPS